jgi:hypothetical protein
VVSGPSPIPHTAGIVLAKGSNQRFIVPIACFYATTNHAKVSDVYPVIHDTAGTIEKKCLEQDFRYQKDSPLWNYEGSMRYASFRLKDGVPEADTAADALYLAYIYLASNEPQKAWAVLEDCRARLGGLTGSAEELKYISWICNDLPYIIPGTENETKKAIRKTPPYIACKLKTLSILCDYLSQDNKIDLPAPTGNENSANTHWARIENEQAVDFLKTLPDNIYTTFTRFQAMRRHLEDAYTVSPLERKRLLDHYQQAQTSEDPPKGALGYEWMLLNLEALQQEQETLLAYQRTGTISHADQKRLLYIEKHFKELKPIIARSSALQLKSITLDLPKASTIKRGHLAQTDQDKLDAWQENLPGDACHEATLGAAIAALSSNIKEEDLVTYFPAYLQIAIGSNEARKNELLAFCSRTLIAERHVPIDNQTKNRALFCNILYRACHNRLTIRSLGAKYNFSRLFNTCKLARAPALQVYEAVDVYKDILATPKSILDTHTPHVKAPVTSPLSNYEPLISRLQSGSTLETLINEYYKLQKEYDEANEVLAQQLTADLEKSHLLEEQAGKNQLRLELKQIEIARLLITTPHALLTMSQIVNEAEPKVLHTVEISWQAALKLANEGPALPKLARSWEIDKAAKKRSSLKKKDLFDLYTQNDLNYTAKKTGLSLEKAQELHEFIHEALVHGIQLKMITRIKDSIGKAQISGQEQDLIAGLDLFAQNAIPALEIPAIVLLQHEDEDVAVLRPRQVSALKSLLERPKEGKPFKERVEKIIPGGGKSKVILPIAAEQKADGTNLVIIEVPQALLATNHVDLNRTSQRLFGKSAYRFEFNRDSNSSSKQLEQIYNRFIEIKSNRGYLVTTGE